MHIAVCEDNIADRKQTERLLSRETAKRSGSCQIYVDSFGNTEALFAAPQKYDLFFVDMNQSHPDGLETTRSLREMGVTAPVVLMNSVINYKETKNAPDNTFYLDKPIKSAELTSLLDQMITLCNSKRPTIELRDTAKSHYLLPEQIRYGIAGDYTVKVTLCDEASISALGTLEDFCRCLTGFEDFVVIGRKYVLNIRHIAEIKKRTVTMDDGTQFQIGITEKKSFLRFLSLRGIL